MAIHCTYKMHLNIQTDRPSDRPATSRRRQAQILVEYVVVVADPLFLPRTGESFLPTPDSCSVVLQFQCNTITLKSKSALQIFMLKLASERGMICPRFLSVDFVFTCFFLLICHSEDNFIILTLISFLNILLNGVRVLTEDIVTLCKTPTDSRG